MPYVYKRTNYNSGKPESVSVNCGCFGCLASIIGLIGILWILFHLTEIARFITG
jgi:hypothetical protein